MEPEGSNIIHWERKRGENDRGKREKKCTDMLHV